MHASYVHSQATDPYCVAVNADAFRRIVAEEGVFALYKGVVPALFLTTHGAFKVRLPMFNC